MKNRRWYLSAMSIALSGTLLVVAGSAEAGNCPDDPKVKKIAIAPDYDGGRITISPDPETIYLGSEETACWEVSGLQDGDWVELRDTSKETKDLEDPFQAGSARLTNGDPHFKGQRPSDAAAGRSWVYDVFVKYTDGEETKVRMKRDPEVVIKEGPRP